MPQAIAVAIITAVAGASAATGAALAVTTALVQIGLSVGLSMLASAFFAPKPSASSSDRQFTNAGPTMPRVRSYGRVRVGGVQIFRQAKRGVLLTVTAHNDGRIHQVVEHVIDENLVTVDGIGRVTTPRYVQDGRYLVNLFWRTGDAVQSSYEQLTAAVPEWTTEHRGSGVAHSLLVMGSPPASRVLDYFPNLDRTAYKQTIDASLVWDPRDSAQDPNNEATWGFTANAALVTLDYLRHRTGFGMPMEWITPELDAWKVAADICDEGVPKKGGGTVKRYTINGSYSYDERPAEVLERFLAAWNAKVWIGSSGGVTVSAGAWIEPTVTISDDAILSYSISAGNEGPDVANTIAGLYTEPALGYRETDAEAWPIPDLVEAFGEERIDARFYEIHSHNQCRRILKQAAAKIAPAWRGVLTCNLLALPVVSERYVRITGTDLDLDITAEVESVDFDVSDGIVTGLTISFASIDATAFAFDAELEEGTPADAPSTIDADVIPPPDNFNVTIEARNVAGGSFAVAVASWDAFTEPGRAVQIEYRQQGAADWLMGPLSASGAVTAETAQLADGVTFEFRAYTAAASRSSEYTATITRSVVVDTVAPGAPTALTATKAGSTVTVGWTNPGSSNTYGARLYRNTSNTPGTATLVTTRYGGPSVALSEADAGLANGTYWWWVAAINGSGVEGTRTAAGTHSIP